MFGDHQPINSPKQAIHKIGIFSQRRALFQQACDNALDQRDVRILEALEAPTIELQADDIGLLAESGLDHFENARFAGAPVAVDPDRMG